MPRKNSSFSYTLLGKEIMVIVTTRKFVKYYSILSVRCKYLVPHVHWHHCQMRS